jgi:hypothetical protein
VWTLEEALEQIPGATTRLPGMAAIFFELGLYGFKDVWIDQSRHRNATPVLTRDVII